MTFHGTRCDFSFSVRAFDTKSRYADYRPAVEGLNLNEAKEEFERQCALYPRSVDTILGLDFTMTAPEDQTEKYKKGAVDLLKCSKGVLKLLEDYKSIDALNKESLISINTINILKEEQLMLQALSDAATVDCIKEIQSFFEVEHTEEEMQRFCEKMCEKYGAPRCQYILANEVELRESKNEIDEPLQAWLKTETDPNYTAPALKHVNARDINGMCTAVYALSETQSKLLRAGLIHGDNHNDLTARSNAVAGEIDHHNELEDGGYAEEDQLSL